MSELVRKTILVSRDEYEKFETRHPGHGDFTWFVREALARYNEINDTNPEELIALAVGEIRTGGKDAAQER